MEFIENTPIVAWALRGVIAVVVLAVAGSAYADHLLSRVPGGTPPPAPRPRPRLVLTVLRDGAA